MVARPRFDLLWKVMEKMEKIWGPRITMAQTAGHVPETRFLRPASGLGQAHAAPASSGQSRRAPASRPFMILLAKSSKNPRCLFQNHGIPLIFLDFS